MSRDAEQFFGLVLWTIAVAALIAFASVSLVLCGRDVQADAACEKKHCEAGKMRTVSHYECVCLERAK